MSLGEFRSRLCVSEPHALPSHSAALFPILRGAAGQRSAPRNGETEVTVLFEAAWMRGGERAGVKATQFGGRRVAPRKDAALGENETPGANASRFRRPLCPCVGLASPAHPPN